MSTQLEEKKMSASGRMTDLVARLVRERHGEPKRIKNTDGAAVVSVATGTNTIAVDLYGILDTASAVLPPIVFSPDLTQISLFLPFPVTSGHTHDGVNVIVQIALQTGTFQVVAGAVVWPGTATLMIGGNYGGLSVSGGGSAAMTFKTGGSVGELDAMELRTDGKMVLVAGANIDVELKVDGTSYNQQVAVGLALNLTLQPLPPGLPPR